MNEEIKKILTFGIDACTFTEVIKFIIDLDIKEIRKSETENSLEIYFSNSKNKMLRIYTIENLKLRITEKRIL